MIPLAIPHFRLPTDPASALPFFSATLIMQLMHLSITEGHYAIQFTLISTADYALLSLNIIENAYPVEIGRLRG